MEAIWNFVVRLRTWIIVTGGVVLMLLPDILPVAAQLLNSPELRAVVPESWFKYIGIAALVVTLWSRWRPATRAADPSVIVEKNLAEAKKAEVPVTVTVEGPDAKLAMDVNEKGKAETVSSTMTLGQASGSAL